MLRLAMALALTLTTLPATTSSAMVAAQPQPICRNACVPGSAHYCSMATCGAASGDTICVSYHGLLN